MDGGPSGIDCSNPSRSQNHKALVSGPGDIFEKSSLARSRLPRQENRPSGFINIPFRRFEYNVLFNYIILSSVRRARYGFFCDLTACQPLIHIYYCIRCAAKSSKMPVSSTISTKGVQLCSWSMARRPTHAIIHPSSLRREELKFAPTLITDRPSCCHGRA